MTGVTRSLAIALTGLTGELVHVEAAVTSQLPGLSIIGLPDAALAEAKQRIRVACQSSGLQLSSRFITLNLSPAELPKNGAGFDLALALSALAASEIVPATRLSSTVHIGELGLDGAVRRSFGVLPAVLAARQAGITTVMVAAECISEASLVSGITVVGVRSLNEAAQWHRGDPLDGPAVTGSRAPHVTSRQSAHHTAQRTEALDMADVVGQADAVDALTIAAIGGHHVSMTGPPGTGKTMLAARVPSLLPDLDDASALEVSSLKSLSGAQPLAQLIRRPPLEAPHHTLTLGAMIGTGTRVVKPGVVSRASGGVLFLDEAPEFSPRVLDALRQPIESGTVSIQRAALSVTLPARFQLILASNPCPCGNSDSIGATCLCDPAARRRYANRISGPLRDRIDIRLSVWRLNRSVMHVAQESPRASSAELRSLVEASRARTRARLRNTPWRLNSQVSGSWLRHHEQRLSPAVSQPLEKAFDDGRVSMRGVDRTLRVAWSFADRDAEPKPSRTHILRALHLRDGIPE